MRHHDLKQFNRWPAVELDRGHPAIERFDRGYTDIPSAEELPKVRPGRHVEEPHAMHLTEHPRLDQNAAQGPAGCANRRCGCRIEVGEINSHDSVLDDRPVRGFEQNLPRIPSRRVRRGPLGHSPWPQTRSRTIAAVKPFHRHGHVTAMVEQRCVLARGT